MKLLFCVLLLAGAAQEKTERVLVLGNSITRHGPAPKIGWTGDWGMAASAAEKDFVHLVSRGLGSPELKATNIADFERGLEAFDVQARLQAEWDFKPTLVIVAIGENVAALKSDEDRARFQAAFAKLLEAAKKTGARLLVRSCFWADPAKDAILRDGCAAAGGIFVDLSALSKDESLYARSERAFEHAGVAAHPGDKGMKAIADAILAALKKP